MFKQLRRFFGGRSEPEERDQASNVLVAPRSGFRPASARLPAPQAVPAAKPASQTCAYDDEDVSISLQSVLDGLPPELKCKVVPMDIRGATLTVALYKVLPQLSSGAVKLSFGEIRRAAPSLFSIGDESDHQEIGLPLNELLVKINPALLPPRQSQNTVTNTDVMDFAFHYADPQLAGAGMLATSAAATPAAAKSTPGPIRVPLPAQVPETAESIAPVPLPVPAPTEPKPPAAGRPDEAFMNVPLAALAANWPAAVRAEIAQLDCAGAQIALPERFVQEGMKQGKVAFPWETVRSWISPTPPSAISNHDHTELNLPLEVLMPLFVARLKQSPKAQPKVVVDESIPALFGPTSPLESTVSIGGNGTTGGMVQVDAPAAAPKTPGTDFKNRYISPTEVVTRAAALDGVLGALVVLPEGLLVAAKLSTSQDPDALAAFLARAFGRVNQSAKESQVGELSQLEFRANSIPWQIFRLNGVLFATFGLAGRTLPASQLAALASEFDRKKRA
jgi:predicted regulator of Ras-like GTPase activity (Roadblock/LC7/MglB family)